MHPYLHIFNFQLPCFGLMMLTGMLSAFFLLLHNHKKTRISEDDLYSVAIVAIVFGLLGAKILYWIVELDEIITDPHFLIETLTNGFVFYGALIGGAIAIGIFCLIKKQNLFTYLDLICPSFAIGQAFGRIGCFLSGCCYGCETDSCLGVIYPAGVGSAAPAGIPLLPTQLFESAFCFLLCLFLCLLFKRRTKNGTVTGWYFILYGIWRFFIEFFRSDDRGAVFGLSTSQFIGIFVVLAGIAILIFFKTDIKRIVSRETSMQKGRHRLEEIKPE